VLFVVNGAQVDCGNGIQPLAWMFARAFRTAHVEALEAVEPEACMRFNGFERGCDAFAWAFDF